MEIVKAFGVSSISVKRACKKIQRRWSGYFFDKRNGRKATILTEDILVEAQDDAEQRKKPCRSVRRFRHKARHIV